MIISACGDIHFTERCPRNRKDDYFSATLNKFEQMLKIVSNTDSKTLLVAGDFFDSPTEPYMITEAILSIIKKYKVRILAVVGQHDLRYHKSGIKNSPIGILVAACEIELLSNTEVTQIGSISIIGSGWGEDPEKKADIMVTHRMVVESDPLWYGQTDYMTGKGLLKKYKWAKCIVSGDNHKPHSVTFKGRTNINCGSMMRSNKNQIEHTPFIWFINTDGWKISKKRLKIDPPEDVFDFDKIERETLAKETKEQALLNAEVGIKKFIDSMPSEERKRPEFKTILKRVIKQNKPKKDIINLANEIMEEVS